MCCEEAVNVILTEKEKFSVDLPECVKNNTYFAERGEIFGILQDRSVVFLERFDKIADKYGIKNSFDSVKIFDLYSSLERLDEKWEIEIKKI